MLAAVDAYLTGVRPHRVVGGTIVTSALCIAAYRLATTPFEDTKAAIFGRLMAVAKVAAGGAITAEAEKMKAKLRHELHKDLGKVYSTVPEEGVSFEEVLRHMDELRSKEERKWSEGYVSGAVYLGEKEFGDFLNKVYIMYSSTNALHPDIWPSLRKYESEVIAMSIKLLNGGKDACGLMTSGGTESLVMACKTYRDWGKSRGITKPEMVVPITAHAAFDKASSYLGIVVHWIPVLEDQTVDIRAVAKAINRNTVLLVGSAPQYAHGVIDDIAALGQLALKHKIGLHVDGCLGGFLLPFLKNLGYPIPPFDMSVPGVTSISADSHKYGYAQKGSSLLLFSNPELRRHTWFCTVNWPGGIYCSPSFQGSRPGGLVATAWASMVAMGQRGYREHAEKVYRCAQKIRAGIANIPGLFVYGSPPAMLISWGSKELNIFAINDKLAAKGWSLNPTHRPAGMHICCTNRTVGREDDLLRDLALAVAEARADPKSGEKGNAPVYGLAATFPDRGTVQDLVSGYLDVLMELHDPSNSAAK